MSPAVLDPVTAPADPAAEPSSIGRSLSIFVPHCSSMLTDHMPHGDGQIAYGFLKRLALRGHRIHVAAQRVEMRDPVPANLHIHLIRTRLKGPLARLEYMIRVRRLFLRLQPSCSFDLIHQMNPVFSGMSLPLFQMGLPVVLGTYVARWPNAGRMGLKQRLANWTRRTIDGIQQRKAAILLLTAPAATNRLTEPEACASKIRWISHGVDTDVFSPIQPEQAAAWKDVEQNHPSILFLANVSTRKGIDPLLRAFASVLTRIPNCRLTVAGKGPQSEAMEKLATDLGIRSHVDFLGHCPREKTAALYRTHAVYTLPSFGEPYATSVLEAMSCGRPVVITNAGGLPDMVPPDGGLRVPVGDADALAAALCHLLESPEERHRMGQRNREHVLKHMRWSPVLDTLEAAYTDALTTTKP